MWLKWNLGPLSTKLGFCCYNEGQFVVARRLYTDVARLPTQVAYVERSIYTCALVCLCCWQWWADCKPYFLPLKQLIVVYLGWRWQTGRVSAWRLYCSEKRLQRRSIIQEEPSSQEGLQQSVVCLLGKLQVTISTGRCDMLSHFWGRCTWGQAATQRICSAVYQSFYINLWLSSV